MSERAGLARRGLAHARFAVLAVALVSAAVALRAMQDYPAGLFDLYPLYYGGRAWLETGSAYDLAAAVPASDHASQLFRVGNLYPLPAVLVVLPLTVLPPHLAGIVWIGLLVGGLVAALRLLRASYWYLLYVPLIEAVRIEQYTALIVIAQLVALWALAERREAARAGRAARPATLWILAACCAVILTKPNHGLLFVIAVLVLSGSWARIALGAALPWLGSVVLDPTWPREWLAVLGRYQASFAPVVLWPMGLLGVPLLLVGDVIGAAVVLQFLLLPFTGSYAASSLLLPLLRSRFVPWLVAASYLWPFVALGVGTPWATALTLVVPMVLASVYERRASLRGTAPVRSAP